MAQHSTSSISVLPPATPKTSTWCRCAQNQRSKGRDLFDLWFALAHGTVDTGALFRSFQRYMAEGGHTVTRAQFERNLHEKARSRGFRRDIQPLLRPDFNRDFDIDKALDIVRERLIKMLPGEPWQGVRG